MVKFIQYLLPDQAGYLLAFYGLQPFVELYMSINPELKFFRNDTIQFFFISARFYPLCYLFLLVVNGNEKLVRLVV